ncbi:MAG: hypothetical protein JWR80_3183 [Bradyrhizobium sp.]|nr:hypothetical protein [Bradyrhizobium sp.]
MTLAESALAALTPEETSAHFFDAIETHGVTYLQTRRYRRPVVPLTSQAHWAAGGFVARYARPGWVGSAAFNYICFEHNPLLAAIRYGRTRYRFSDFAAHDDVTHGDYWSALSEAAIGEAICATAYGADRGIASLHIGFTDRNIPPDLAADIAMAGNIIAERLIAFDIPGDAPWVSPLSARERDALMLVAEGKTDWEIATIMGFSQSTARFHVDNARRKLGCVNRAHAVARLLALSGAF